MSIVKIANRLTKVFNSLSEAAQKDALPFLRSEKVFINGIERGNRRLLSEMQRKIKRPIRFKDGASFGHDALNNVSTMRVPKHPKTLDDAITKRHEIFEAQQELRTKGLHRQLRQEKSREYANREFARKEAALISARRKRLMRLKVEPEKEDRVYKALDYLDQKIMKNNDRAAYVRPQHYFSHSNPQVLLNEHKLLKETPRSFNTDIFKYRHASGEASDMQNRFKFIKRYGVANISG